MGCASLQTMRDISIWIGSDYVSVGMPNHIYLEQYATILRTAFNAIPYHVGSSVTTKSNWRDVDVRLILDDEVWEQWGFGDPYRPNLKWTAYCAAFAELGRKMTELPIDFQIQQMSMANEYYKPPAHTREALGIMYKE